MSVGKAPTTASRIATIGILSALGTGLMFLEFPIFPVVNFLKYDPSDILALLAAFVFGPVDGILVILTKNLLFYLLKSADIVGIMMNFVAGVSYLLPTVLIYRVRRNRLMEIVGYVTGVIVVTGVMAVMNMLVVPFYWKVKLSDVLVLLPWISAFNVVKFGFNSVVNALLHERIERIFE